MSRPDFAPLPGMDSGVGVGTTIVPAFFVVFAVVSRFRDNRDKWHCPVWRNCEFNWLSICFRDTYLSRIKAASNEANT
jgi:hypothetical protein